MCFVLSQDHFVSVDILPRGTEYGLSCVDHHVLETGGRDMRVAPAFTVALKVLNAMTWPGFYS